MELTNTHCHSCYTNHGYGQIEEYVVEAEKAGLTTLAFTEHFPLSPAFDPHDYLSMHTDRVDSYLADIKAAQERHPGITLMTGCELDYLSDAEDRVLTRSDFDRFQVVNLSVHFVDAWPFDDPALRDRWEEPGQPDFIWKRYFDIWCEACMSDARGDIMSHPDLAKKFAYYPTYDVMPLYKQAAEACAESGRMIELNTSGSYYACKEMFPAPALLREFCRAGIPATIGTDSHQPEHVARDLAKGHKALYEAGYRVITVSTPDGDRRTIPIQ